MDELLQVKPKVSPPLDPDFRPGYLGNRAMALAAKASGRPVPLALALRRSNGNVSVYRATVLPAGHASERANLDFADRILKYLLWQKGSARIFVSGPK